MNAGRGALRLFAPDGSDGAGRLSALLGVDLSRHEWRAFGGGEHKIRPLDPVRGDDVYVFAHLHGHEGLSCNDRLCRTWFLCAALRDHGAARVTLVAPYLPYGRKDRRTQAFDPVNTRYLAMHCEVAGIDRVLSMDVHNPAAFENAFRRPAYSLSARSALLAAAEAHLGDGPLVVLSPDAGGMKRAEAFRAELATRRAGPVALGMMEKYRSGDRLSGSQLFADVTDATVLIVDDLLASGGTLARAARAAREHGARRVLALITHGLFSEGDPGALAGAPIDRLLISDSAWPLPPAAAGLGDRLQVVATASVWADAIERLHGERAFDEQGVT